MTIVKHNDAPAVEQTLENAQKLLAMVVWKLAPQGVRITVDDMERFAAEGGVFLTHGHRDSFEFKIVTPEEAERIKSHEAATNEGHA